MSDTLLTQIEQDTEDGEATSRRSPMDPELRVMGQMLRMIDDLEVRARTRVVAYIISRYIDTP